MEYKNLKPACYELPPIYSGSTWITEFESDIEFADCTGICKIDDGTTNGLLPTVTFDLANKRFSFSLAATTRTSGHWEYKFHVVNSLNEPYLLFYGSVEIRP